MSGTWSLGPAFVTARRNFPTAADPGWSDIWLSGDRSKFVYLGQGCSARCPQRDSGSSDVAVPQGISAKGAVHDEPGGIVPGLVESKNTSAESAIQFGG